MQRAVKHSAELRHSGMKAKVSKHGGAAKRPTPGMVVKTSQKGSGGVRRQAHEEVWYWLGVRFVYICFHAYDICRVFVSYLRDGLAIGI